MFNAKITFLPFTVKSQNSEVSFLLFRICHLLEWHLCIIIHNILLEGSVSDVILGLTFVL